MASTTNVKQRLLALLMAEKFGVLSTCGERQPYASLVAFAATKDLSHIVFVTPRPTKKYANLAANAKVALLVDNRSNRVSDLKRAMGATAVGTVVEVRKIRNSRLIRTYLDKHPQLADFAWAATSAVFDLRVETYSVVERFQEVTRLQLTGP
jgi:nitroimidazol reductase NimA-like FMN-containing flavoprotein (pyridoxamine 5'-phosphate oxidase superfamily)